MSPVERAARRTFRSLHTRNFRLYFFGQVVSGTGSWMQLVAQAWLVLHLTHSGVALGLTLALQFAPILLAGAWGGVLADRLDKRRLLIATAAASGALALVLGAITAAGVVEVWMVYVLAVALGVVTAIDNPARRSFVPEMVPPGDVANAVGLNSTVFTAARVVGPAVAGLVIATLGVEWCFLLNGVSFVAVMLALRAMRPGRAASRADGRARQAPAARRLLLRLAQPAGAPRADRDRGDRDAGLQLPGRAPAHGERGARRWGRDVRDDDGGARRRFARWRTLGRALRTREHPDHGGRDVRCSASRCRPPPLAPSLVTELAALAVVGLSAMVLISMATAICNEATAPELRGRVMAMFSIAFLGSTPIGAPLVGWISETLGPRAGPRDRRDRGVRDRARTRSSRGAATAPSSSRSTSTDVELAESVADAA